MLAQQPDLRATHEKRLSPHQYYPALVDRVFYVDDPAATGLGAFGGLSLTWSSQVAVPNAWLT